MSTHSPLVIKIGGKFFDLLAANDDAMDHFFDYVKSIIRSCRHVVLVHGGGTQVTKLLAALGRPSDKLDGLRITPDFDIDIVAGVLCGQLNKRLAAKCYSHRINSVGISLADGNLANCKQISKALGWVGEPTDGNAKLLTALFTEHLMPIIATVGCDQKGNLFNVNADHAAVHIAKLIKADLILLSDVAGVLDNRGELISHLDKARIDSLIHKGIITDGMLVKVNAAKSAADEIGRTVTIASWHDAKASESGQALDIGTKITPESLSQTA